jgi:hypothetical protein
LLGEAEDSGVLLQVRWVSGGPAALEDRHRQDGCPRARGELQQPLRELDVIGGAEVGSLHDEHDGQQTAERAEADGRSFGHATGPQGGHHRGYERGPHEHAIAQPPHGRVGRVRGDVRRLQHRLCRKRIDPLGHQLPRRGFELVPGRQCAQVRSFGVQLLGGTNLKQLLLRQLQAAPRCLDAQPGPEVEQPVDFLLAARDPSRSSDQLGGARLDEVLGMRGTRVIPSARQLTIEAVGLHENVDLPRP